MRIFLRPKYSAILMTLCLLLFASTIKGTLADGNNTNYNLNITDKNTPLPKLPKSGNNPTFLTYQEHDLGIEMKYPSNWMKLEDYLRLHTIAAFNLIHTDTHDRTNTSLAEVDLRIYPAPQNQTSGNISIRQINIHNEVVLNYSKPSNQMLMLSVLKPIYHSEELQKWIEVPAKHLLFEIIYISDSQLYSEYLPGATRIIDSFEISN